MHSWTENNRRMYTRTHILHHKLTKPCPQLGIHSLYYQYHCHCLHQTCLLQPSLSYDTCYQQHCTCVMNHIIYQITTRPTINFIRPIFYKLLFFWKSLAISWLHTEFFWSGKFLIWSLKRPVHMNVWETQTQLLTVVVVQHISATFQPYPMNAISTQWCEVFGKWAVGDSQRVTSNLCYFY